MDEAALRRIAQAYNIEPRRIDAAQTGYRNHTYRIVTGDGRERNLIIYKDEPGMAARVRQTNRIGDYAAAHGLPARRTADQRVLQLQTGERRRYAGLYVYLPGHTIPWEAYTRAHLKLLGRTLSSLHAVLATMPQPATNPVSDEYLAILRRIECYFSDAPVKEAIAAKLGISVELAQLRELRTVVHVSKQLPGQQTLHMDFVRGNLLFTGRGDILAISGILDFEKAAYGHPLFDVARTLAFLIVDCKYKPENTIRKYFWRSGYNKRSTHPLRNITINVTSENNISILDSLINLFLLYDFYKFLRHNPYEFLHQNEHFMRTKQILINRNIIRPAKMLE